MKELMLLTNIALQLSAIPIKLPIAFRLPVRSLRSGTEKLVCFPIDERNTKANC